MHPVFHKSLFTPVPIACLLALAQDFTSPLPPIFITPNIPDLYLSKLSVRISGNGVEGGCYLGTTFTFQR